MSRHFTSGARMWLRKLSVGLASIVVASAISVGSASAADQKLAVQDGVREWPRGCPRCQGSTVVLFQEDHAGVEVDDAFGLANDQVQRLLGV